MLYGAERIAAGVALIGLAPLFALIALAIAILSRRGPFVRHQRVGWKGTPLGMIKLRTMWDQSTGRFQWVEDVGGPVTDAKHEYDVRVTSRFAALCRRYSIDELPQLYHVVRGEMSLVGPRPVTRAELESHYGPQAAEVLSMRPGMTGLWQILGRSHLTYSRRRRLDLILVRRASVRLYVRILLRSLPVVVSGQGAY